MRYLVGARWACLSCLRRTTATRCTRCGERGDVLDLEDDHARAELSAIRASSRLGALHKAPLNPLRMRGMPWGRKLLWLSTRGAFVFGALFWWLTAPPSEGALHFVLRVVMSGFAGVVAIVAVIVALIAVLALFMGAAGLGSQTLRTAVLFTGGARRRSLERGAESLLAAAFDVIERAFLARLRVDESPPALCAPTTRVRAVLREGAITVVSDPRGDIEVRDALVGRLEVDDDSGNTVIVECECGVVECDASLQREGHTVLRRLEHVDTDMASRERTRSHTFSRGARLVLEGGEWSEEADPNGTEGGFRAVSIRRVVRGTTASPLRVRVFAA